MTDWKPRAKSNLTLKDLGDEYIIYSSEQKAMHVLNPTAKVIWTLCDGTHTLQDLETGLRARFAIPEGNDIAEDIQSVLQVFSAKGLLENEAGLE